MMTTPNQPTALNQNRAIAPEELANRLQQTFFFREMDHQLLVKLATQARWQNHRAGTLLFL
ncbi:MAG: hypothetical protein KDE31_33910 [Caldilineaceae bacterium]|nr:hypothetical protein [Caldilineaceae bacterium]